MQSIGSNKRKMFEPGHPANSQTQKAEDKRGWRDCVAVESVYSSHRGPEFGS